MEIFPLTGILTKPPAKKPVRLPVVIMPLEKSSSLFKLSAASPLSPAEEIPALTPKVVVDCAKEILQNENTQIEERTVDFDCKRKRG